MTRDQHPTSRPNASPLLQRLAIGSCLLLGACGAGPEDTGGSGGGGGGGGGNPGGGGGPGAPGNYGNPLSIPLTFSVDNRANEDRTETVTVSVPFPEGGYQPTALDDMVVNGHQTAWLPLQLWPDGSVKVAQAQFTDEVEASEKKSYEIGQDESALEGSFERNEWVAQFWPSLEIGAQVRDTFQVGYRGFLEGDGEVLQSTPLIETRRYRTYHQPWSGTGIGRDFLTSTFYVTEYHDMPFVMVDWIVGNDYLGADNVPANNDDPNLVALGTVDVSSAHFLVKGATEALPYRKDKHSIESSSNMDGNYDGFRVMNQTYIGDGSTRRYRFLLRFEPNGAQPADLERWSNTASAMIGDPMFALASQETWERTAAAGLLGGPLAGPADANQWAQNEYEDWDGRDWFGTWGARGDAQGSATTGTPRNHPLSPELAHAIQGQNHLLLTKLEQMAWIQAVRPYHLYGLEVGAEQQILLWDGLPSLNLPGEHLGRARVQKNSSNDPYPNYRPAQFITQPHGWNHFDHEHWSTDLLFDYWTVSGDAWAKEELRQLGESLKGLMRLQYYYTSALQEARAEGWCMHGFAQIYQVTRDESLKQYAMRRVNEIIEPERSKDHPSKALRLQSNYPTTQYPQNNEFFMPWQHGAVLYGFLGAYRVFEEPALLTIAEDVATTVEYSWVTNMNHPSFGFVAQGLRYYVPASFNGSVVPANYWDGLSVGAHFGDSPLGGAHTFLLASLFLLADETEDTTVQAKALQYGEMIRGDVSDSSRWNKWVYCLPQWYVPGE
ncbi:MAG: hypothetical protein AB8H80_03215 [Planctomycetota bacterium]